MRREKLYLTDIVEAADAIEQFISEIEPDGFVDNDLYRSAVLQKLAIIGEAVKTLVNKFEYQEKYPEVEWRDFVDFRNVLVHAYFSIKFSIVWEAAIQDIPELRQKVAEILQQEFGTTKN